MTPGPKAEKPAKPPVGWGSWEDAERLREWSFLERTPEQRLAWLTEALEIAYLSGALVAPATAAAQM